MSINYKFIEAIQAVVEVGNTIEHLEKIIQEQECDISRLRITANELERKLEASEMLCKNEASSRDEIEAKLAETLKVNENLRLARNEEAIKYEKVCAELTEAHKELEDVKAKLPGIR